MASRGSDSGGMAAFFGLLILIWVVVTYYWVILGVGAAVGLFFAVRALVRRAQERRLERPHTRPRFWPNVPSDSIDGPAAATPGVSMASKGPT